MKLKITKANIDKIKRMPEGIYRDSDLIGFAIRVRATKQTYIVDKKLNNRVIRKTIGNVGALTPEQAKKQAQILLGEMAKGIDIVAEEKKERAKSISLINAYIDYKTTRNLGEKTIYDYDRAMETTFKEWKNKEVTKINRDMIEKKFKNITEQSPAVANLHFRLLRAIFNFASEKYCVDGEPIIPSNPCNRLKALKLWNRIERKETYIKPAQIKTFFHSLTIDKNDVMQMQQAKRQCMICLFTGARDQEVASLKKKNIDFEDNTITFEKTKNHHTHVLPLGKWLREYLLDFCSDLDADDYIFPANNKSGHLKDHRKAIKQIAKDCSINFSLHDLRRTFSSIVDHDLGIGFTPYTIKRLLNHAQNDVTGGYIRFGIEDLRKPMQLIEDFILTKAGIKEDASAEVVDITGAKKNDNISAC